MVSKLFMMLQSLQILLPEIFLSFAALTLLTIDAFVGRRLKQAVLWVSFLSLAVTLLIILKFSITGRAFGMIAVDPFSIFFKILAIIGAFLVFLLSEKDDVLIKESGGTYASLILFSTVGVMLLSSAEDLLILFIAMELTTLPLFILAGFLRKDLRSSEGAVKFFLIGALSTGLMLYGISFLYGVTGSTHFSALHEQFLKLSQTKESFLFLVGVLFLIAGLAFKFSLVPFHEWTPDTYEGAPTPITAFFSVSREAGVLAVLLRFLGEFVNISSAGLTPFFIVISVVTMTLGNLAALRQNNLKRLLAYSSIAHAGTILIGLIANNALGREGSMVYAYAYLLTIFGTFALVIAVARVKNSEDISAFDGLAKENLPVACLMFFFLLSLAGIPPLLGFWGKFTVFAAAIESQFYFLVAIALVNAVISAYYYFRVARRMFFENRNESYVSFPSSIDQSSIQIAAVLTAAALLILGLFPEPFLAWIRSFAHFLP